MLPFLIQIIKNNQTHQNRLKHAPSILKNLKGESLENHSPCAHFLGYVPLMFAFASIAFWGFRYFEAFQSYKFINMLFKPKVQLFPSLGTFATNNTGFVINVTIWKNQQHISFSQDKPEDRGSRQLEPGKLKFFKLNSEIISN